MADLKAELDPWVREILRCPVTGAELVDGAGPDGEPELHSIDPRRPLEQGVVRLPGQSSRASDSSSTGMPSRTG